MHQRQPELQQQKQQQTVPLPITVRRPATSHACGARPQNGGTSILNTIVSSFFWSFRSESAAILPPIQRHLSHPQSQPNIHQGYQFEQHRQHHYGPMDHSDAAACATPTTTRLTTSYKTRYTGVSENS